MSIQNFQKVLFALFAIVALQAAPGDAESATDLLMRGGTILTGAEISTATANGSILPQLFDLQPTRPESTIPVQSRDEQLRSMGLERLDLAFVQVGTLNLTMRFKELYASRVSEEYSLLHDPISVQIKKVDYVDPKGNNTIITGITSCTVIIDSDTSITFTPFGHAFLVIDGKLSLLAGDINFIHPKFSPKKNHSIQASIYYPQTGPLSDAVKSISHFWSKTTHTFASWTAVAEFFHPEIWQKTEVQSPLSAMPGTTDQIVKFMLNYTPPLIPSTDVLSEIQRGKYNHKTPDGEVKFSINPHRNTFDAIIRLGSAVQEHVDEEKFPHQEYDSFLKYVVPFSPEPGYKHPIPRQVTVPLMIALRTWFKHDFPAYTGPVFGRVDKYNSKMLSATNEFRALDLGLQQVLSGMTEEGYGPWMKLIPIEGLIEKLKAARV